MDEVLLCHSMYEHEQRAEWERARWGWLYTAKMYAKIHSPTKLHRFPWEASMMSRARVQDLKNRFKNDKRFPSKI